MSRFALTVSIITLLAGCAGPQPPIGAPGTMQQSRAIVAHADRGGSWMLPEAKSEDLIYLSATFNVYVFGFHSGKLVGTISGFYDASGLCVDARGDVFVTDGGKEAVFEFAHGNDSIKRTFPDAGYEPVGCAVDRVSGDLAVTNYCGVIGSQQCHTDGDVVIFDHARGKPRVYSSSSIGTYVACDYDNTGNLYVSGRGRYSQSVWLVKLSASRKSFVAISLDQDLGEAPIQWDGTHLTAADTTSRVIYQFVINGKRGVTVGTTTIENAYFFQYWITDGKVLAPTILTGRKLRYHRWIYYYGYPTGGRYVRKVRSPDVGYGITVSKLRG